MREKSHCCCCIHLSDGVILVGIYGASFHAGLLVIQSIYGPTLTAPFPADPNSDTVIHPILLSVHIIGIVVNALLVIGAHFSRGAMMLPWLLAQGILALLLSGLALYYLVLYPDSTCLRPGAEWISGDCNVLLWHAVIMVLSTLILVYYIYIVHEFLVQLRLQAMRNEKTLEEIFTIERRSEQPQHHQHMHQMQPPPVLPSHFPQLPMSMMSPPPHSTGLTVQPLQQQEVSSSSSTTAKKVRIQEEPSMAVVRKLSSSGGSSH